MEFVLIIMLHVWGMDDEATTFRLEVSKFTTLSACTTDKYQVYRSLPYDTATFQTEVKCVQGDN